MLFESSRHLWRTIILRNRNNLLVLIWMLWTVLKLLRRSLVFYQSTIFFCRNCLLSLEILLISKLLGLGFFRWHWLIRRKWRDWWTYTSISWIYEHKAFHLVHESLTFLAFMKILSLDKRWFLRNVIRILCYQVIRPFSFFITWVKLTWAISHCDKILIIAESPLLFLAHAFMPDFYFSTYSL